MARKTGSLAVSPNSFLLSVLNELKSSVIPCDDWAIAHRVLPKSGPWRFHRHKYLQYLHTVKARIIVVKKGAQIGVTECMVNRAFHLLDVRRIDVLYLFPTSDDASDFSAGRFDQALELSPHLQAMFSDVSNVGHKRAGAVNFYCRGSRSRSKLKTVPVGGLFVDEFDEMSSANIPLARERLSGHDEKMEMDASTPTIPDFGITREWNESSQHRFHIRCDGCSRIQPLTWDQSGHGSIDWHGEDSSSASFQCIHCKKKWTNDHKIHLISEGEWVKETSTGHEIKVGFDISQLYSPTITAEELVEAFLKSVVDEFRRQEFYNSKLGMPYVPAGAKLQPDEVLKAIRGGVHILHTSVASTMGIDVGADLHRIEISEWVSSGEVKKVIYAAKVTWDDLPKLIQQYNVRTAIIDAAPERAKSRDLVKMFPGRVFMAFYPEGMKNLYTIDEKRGTVNIHRTEALDTIISRYRKGTVWLPTNLPSFEDYSREMCSPTRIMKRHPHTGEPVARYVESDANDHFAHASVYNEIAHEISPFSTEGGTTMASEIHEPVQDGIFSF